MQSKSYLRYTLQMGKLRPEGLGHSLGHVDFNRDSCSGQEMGSDPDTPAKVSVLPHRIEPISRATSYGLSPATCSGSSGRWRSSNGGCDRSRRGECGQAYIWGNRGVLPRSSERHPDPTLALTELRLPP